MFNLSSAIFFFSAVQISSGIYRMSCRRDALFKISAKNSKLEVASISTSTLQDLNLCARLCLGVNACKCFNYNAHTKSCEALSKNKQEVGNDKLKSAESWNYYEPIIYEDSPRCRPRVGVELCSETQACDEICSNPVGYRCRNLANIALGKSTSQSSTVNGGYANRAVDGNTATSWPSGSCTHTNSEVGWWRVDFGKTARVHSVRITNRGDCCGSRLSNFNIRVGGISSGNGGANEACAMNQNVGQGATSTFKCRPRLLGRYLYVQQNRVDPLTLCEVQVFGDLN